jgi:hypothetical protein
MADEDLSRAERSRPRTSGSEPARRREPQGQREGRRVGVRARPVSGHAVQGAVDQAARDG